MDSNKIIINKANFISFKRHSITRDYKIEKSLGVGAFGSVKIAIHKQTGQTRAVKILKKSEQDEQKLFLEVEILAKLSHPNIMQVYEFYEDSTIFYIVSEYCSGGELFDYLTKKVIFSEKEASHIMKQILSAICYSHDNNIVHRDLKPENILLDDNSGSINLKLIDWGGASFFSKDKKMSNINGTPYYIAPEVLDEKYDEKCDIWSCGVILYILMSGNAPFNGESDYDILKAVKIGKYDFPPSEWDNVSKECKDLISSMLKYDPKHRLSARECMSHPWFKKVSEISKDMKLSDNLMNNIVKFKKTRKLEQATMNFIVTQLLNKEETKKLQVQFKSWDKNGDGVLSRDEIYDGYKQLKGEVFASEEVDEIMKTVDLDGNGYIDYNEFLTAAVNREKIVSKQNLEMAFRSFDKDGSGFISTEEIMNVFSNLKDKSIVQDMIKEIDSNGDGEISLLEFKNIMLKNLN